MLKTIENLIYIHNHDPNLIYLGAFNEDLHSINTLQISLLHILWLTELIKRLVLQSVKL